MIETALPVWASAGWDAGRGGFVDRLHADGVADADATRRIFVQARQIHVFARAAHLGWFPRGASLALQGLEYLRDKGRSDAGGYVHRLTPEGTVHDGRRDTYDHAFVLLALASVFELTRDAQVKSAMDELLDFFDGVLQSPHGGYVEGVPFTVPRRQNPQMHVFEAMIAGYLATNDARYRTRAAALFDLFMVHLFDAKTNTVGEYYHEGWIRRSDLPGDVEPGHHAEWVWLLRQYQTVSHVDTAPAREKLLATALRYRDAATGCLIDEGDRFGKMTKGSRRCWPQTELVRAFAAQAESGDVDARHEARAALSRLARHYLAHPVAGGWYDCFDAGGQSTVDFVPASSLYHVFGAISEADRVLDQIG